MDEEMWLHLLQTVQTWYHELCAVLSGKTFLPMEDILERNRTSL
jgi:hypothetical protein